MPVTRFREIWMKMRADARGLTPFGIHPVYLLMIFFAAIIFTGNPLKAYEPIEQLIVERGGLNRYDRQNIQEILLKNFSNFEVYALIAVPPLIGVVFDYGGSALTIALSCLQLVLGYSFIIFPKYQTKALLSAGSFLLSSSYYTSFLTHNIVTGLFPVNEALCVAILGTAAKLSEFVPGMLRSISKAAGSIIWTFVGYFIIILIIGIVEIVLLHQADNNGLKKASNKNNEFLASETAHSIDKKKSSLSHQSSDCSNNTEQIGKVHEQSFASRSTVSEDYVVQGLRNSLKTIDYWIFAVISCIMVIQERSEDIVADSLRNIVGLRTPLSPLAVKSVNELYTDIGWLSFIPLLCFGVAFDLMGIPVVIAIVQFIVTLIYILASIGVYPLFIVLNSLHFLVADMTTEIKIVFMVHYFGLKNIGILMGILETLSNLTFLGVLYGILLVVFAFISDVSRALLLQCAILWIGGLVVFPLSLLLWYLSKKRKQRNKEKRKAVARKSLKKDLTFMDSINV